MQKKWISRFHNLPLLSKMTIVICGLALAISSIITVTSIIYYGSVSSQRLLNHARTSARNAANTFEVNYTNILERFVFTCGTKEFMDDLKTMSLSQDPYMITERLVQNELSDLASCNYLVHAAMLLSGNGTTAYTTYNNRLRGSVEALVTREELANVTGITFLPRRVSPFRSSTPVIPIFFPLNINAADYIEINLEGTAPAAYIVILLDCTKLESSLDLANVKQSQSAYYLVTPAGTALSLSAADELPGFFSKDSTKELISDLLSGTESQQFSVGTDSYLIGQRLHPSGLVLLNYVQRETIQNIFGTAGMMLLLILVVVVGVILAISYLMTSYITRPVNWLVQVVQQIERNEYTEKQQFATRDEIGQLSAAINNMYDTIQQQILCIKQEESEKYLAEIKLLTEQINPHFLYNTLECIQSEVIRGETETAAGMIRYLADYLRIGLAYGADFIPISNELRHANAYIKIMNERFRQSILFMHQIEPGLSQQLILKTILQPLVENSIKHGFGIDAPGMLISVPTIEINFFTRDETLVIDVIDNGSGFDIATAERITYASDPEALNHVGLHNVYRRLVTFYGRERVDISFSSIPYYRNSVTITIPLLAGEPET